MDPTAEPFDPPTEAVPVAVDETVETEPRAETAGPQSPDWYGTAEFRLRLLLHFQKARRKAIASNPPDMPG